MSRSKVLEPVSGSEVEGGAPLPPPSSEKKKRKADEIDEDDKLEIDVNLPEPPSKKAKRLEKKKKESKTRKPAEISDAAKAIAKEYSASDGAQLATTGGYAGTGAAAATRSEYGIWIGNLPWSATKDSLRAFLKDQGGIQGNDIVRVHMPAPAPDRNNDNRIKAQNKGFAYVDFTTEAVQNVAMGLSEKLMTGRRVLIKNAKSFEGRPQKTAEDATTTTTGVTGGKKEKEPAKRVFIGNLSFDVTQEDLAEHFSIAGEIEDIHMATFEDSGKCKGFAWVRFKEVEAAEAAVRGFVYRKAEGGNDSDSDDAEIIVDNAADTTSKKKKSKSKAKRHKQHIDQLHGRDLRREFAEDSQTRYKKRYGKDAAKPRVEGQGQKPAAVAAVAAAADGEDNLEDLVRQAASARDFKGPKPRAQKRDADQRRDERRKKHEDARNIAPGKALANAQRSTGAIVAGAGKRQTFD